MNINEQSINQCKQLRRNMVVFIIRSIVFAVHSQDADTHTHTHPFCISGLYLAAVRFIRIQERYHKYKGNHFLEEE